MRITSSVTAAMLVASLACAGAQEGGMAYVDEATDIAAVEAVATAELNTLIAGDIAANLALMTDDVVIMPPNEPALTGADAEGFFSGFLEALTMTSAEYVSHDISIHGDIAIDAYHGKLLVTPAGSDEPVEMSVKGIHVMQRQADGSWKISHDVWNDNEAAGHE
jgi:ketosteroid isomerase-like protein